jgi:hypothetical protein
MWSVLSSSRSTIETLWLPDSSSDEGACNRLFSMHFPHLRSLTLGIWGFDICVTGTDFTEFLIANSDTLEDLDLEYGQYDEYALALDRSSLARLRPDMLPRLRSFKGNTQTLMIMAQARMRCLKTSLQSLTVGPGGVDAPTYAVEWMFDAIISSTGNGPALGCFPAVTELDLDISQWEDVSEKTLSAPYESAQSFVRR